MNTGNQNGAAMSLWDKYGDLRIQAENHRSDRLACESKTAQLRTEIEQLESDLRTEMENSRSIKEETEKFRTLLDAEGDLPDTSFAIDAVGHDNTSPTMTIHKQLQVAEKEFQDQTDRLNAIERSWEQWNNWKQDQIIGEQERNQQWRQDVQRLQCEAISVGLPNAYLDAAYYSSGRSAPQFDDTSEDAQSCDVLAEGDENDPLSWTSLKDDVRLQESVETYKKHKDIFSAAKSDFQTWNEKVQAEQAKCEKKKQRAASLREQIQKVNNDLVYIKTQIRKLSPTSTANEQGAMGVVINPHLRESNNSGAHAQSAHQASSHIQHGLPSTDNRTQAHGTIQPRVRNPYARGSVQQPTAQVTPPPNTTQVSQQRRSDFEDTCVGRRRLVGRDRQFICSVGIGMDDEEEANTNARNSTYF